MVTYIPVVSSGFFESLEVMKSTARPQSRDSTGRGTRLVPRPAFLNPDRALHEFLTMLQEVGHGIVLGCEGFDIFRLPSVAE